MELEADLTYFKLARTQGARKASFSVEFPQLGLEIRQWELVERDGRLIIEPPSGTAYAGSTVKTVVLWHGELLTYVRDQAIALYEKASANVRPH
ncbi:hypothetical protein G6M87_08380 [Rhizobium rhizogenes]|uniref:hypothetical protein n=1 Tax=Rhizobium rhizogenes TaxID=359 RepID=UPI001AAFE1BA|nr:hypothetical protein [Rhizobium rhizogenes]QTG05490.1 hypothetical protein G6M87_08380 [Rhizobium rhizogenes]